MLFCYLSILVGFNFAAQGSYFIKNVEAFINLHVKAIFLVGPFYRDRETLLTKCTGFSQHVKR